MNLISSTLHANHNEFIDLHFFFLLQFLLFFSLRLNCAFGFELLLLQVLDLAIFIYDMKFSFVSNSKTSHVIFIRPFVVSVYFCFHIFALIFVRIEK